MDRIVLTAGVANPVDGTFVRLRGGRARLTPREQSILARLVRRPRRIVTRNELALEWGLPDASLARVVNNTVASLRRKIERDPATPDHVHTVHGVGWRFVETPAERPGLPEVPQPQPLFGRGEDRDKLAARLETARWMTLTGPPGVGKTALAASLLRGRPDTGWVDLTGAVDLDAALASVASALGVRLTGIAPTRQLAEALAARGPICLGLDGADRTPIGPVLDRWLAAAPDLRVVVTARAALGGAAEAAIPVAPLAAQVAADWLARAAGTAQDTERLAAALDHLPLALHIAAARLTLMSPQQLLDRLGLEALHPPPGPTGLQHTLSRALDLTWDLLAPEEQDRLVALTVFPADFSSEAAAAVAGGSPHALHAQHLLMPGPRGHRLLRPVRAWASRRGPVLADAAQRHARWFAAWGARDDLDGPRAAELTARLLGDAADLDAALSTACEAGDAPLAVACASALARARSRTGPPDAMFAPIDRALATDPDPVAVGRLRRARSHLLLQQAAWAEAQIEAAHASAAARSAGDTDTALLATADRVRAASYQGHVAAALAWAGEALDGPEGSDTARARLIAERAHALQFAGRYADATRDLQAAMAVFAAHGMDAAVAELVSSPVAPGPRAAHGERLRTAIALYRSTGATALLPGLHNRLGRELLRLGQWAAARSELQTAVGLLEAEGRRNAIGWIAVNLAFAAAQQGAWSDALDHLDEAESAATARSEAGLTATVAAARESVFLDRGDLDDALLWNTRAAACYQTADQAIQVAITAGNRGEILLAMGRWEPAVQALEAAVEALATHPPARACFVVALAEARCIGGVATDAEVLAEALAVLSDTGERTERARALVYAANAVSDAALAAGWRAEAQALADALEAPPEGWLRRRL
ncbi:MAG: tetratricopeptide (TPR) repeat protein/DNA-binding winged helix-turn-helix (wHTH) protein [Myxococcota bacterium]|jgi:tetratricopeptide (TPR) repeat protein/DNA-binding winged helix-turn-helix (wHTH) protein